MSMMQSSPEQERAQPVFTRSLESCAFEEFWRSMRGPSLIPARKDFNLARASRFIRNLVLLEAPHPDRPGMRIRIAGEGYQQFAGHSLAGTDHLELLAPEYREGARLTGDLMVTTPCGLWQVSPVYCERGFGRFIEVTAFPMGAGDDGIALLICHLRMMDDLLPSGVPAGRGLSFDTAAQYRFIDIGTGLPDLSDLSAA